MPLSPKSRPDDHRIDRLVREYIAQLGLDLSGLVVMTEAATGPYLYSSVIVALGGAEHVYAVTRDSRFGRADDVAALTRETARKWGVEDRIEIVRGKTAEAVARTDIFTNSGFVRPLDRETVAAMKETAVIPLMWETWEFRPSDLDLGACREKGILVLGTDERKAPLDMYRYVSFLGLRLLFDLGLEGHRSRVILLGGCVALGPTILELFEQAGIETVWFSKTAARSKRLEEFRDWFAEHGGRYDAILVAEHHYPDALLGPGGLIDYPEIARVNAGLRIGVMAGEVGAEALKASGLRYAPETILPFGFMSYQPSELGPRPVVELFTGGLKVGEAMARARLRGLSVQDSARFALTNSPAMDFQGELAWVSGYAKTEPTAGGRHESE